MCYLLPQSRGDCSLQCNIKGWPYISFLFTLPEKSGWKCNKYE